MEVWWSQVLFVVCRMSPCYLSCVTVPCLVVASVSANHFSCLRFCPCACCSFVVACRCCAAVRSTVWTGPEGLFEG